MAALPRPMNLLPQTEFDSSVWGRLIKWALTTGRYIIILTEVIIILAFLSRFKLDRDLSDLTESIAGKKNVLTALGPDEQKFRRTQAKLAATNILLQAQIPESEIWTEIDATVVPGISFNNIGMDPTMVTVNATAVSESTMGEFLKRNSQNPRWKSVDLSDVSWDQGNGIRFTVQLTQ